MKLIQKIISVLLVVVMLIPTFISCSSGEAKEKYIYRPYPQKYQEDLSQTRLFPKPENETSKNIDYIDISEMSPNDSFLATVFQGRINSVTPSIYVIGTMSIEGSDSVKLSELWFEKLDDTYGSGYFNKTEYTDLYELIAKYADQIDGYVLYHERIADAEMRKPTDFASRMADTAVLNLTIMLCSQKNAIPLTLEQAATLAEYGVELPCVGDTIQFMAKDEAGKLIPERDCYDVWKKVYLYALNNIADDLSKTSLMHNIGLSFANFDLATMSKSFLYNRYVGPNEEQKYIEQCILRLTEPNTPCFGVFTIGVGGDEHEMVSTLAANGKMMTVTYETYNLSWTSGLPTENFLPENVEEEEEEIVLDESKNYIAFSYTETDNTSYTFGNLPFQYDDAARYDTASSWGFSSVIMEAMPNVVKYVRDNWNAADSIMCAEAGAGYILNLPPENTRSEYYALTDEYLKRMNADSLRILFDDNENYLPFAENLTNLNSVFSGYIGHGINYYNNNEDANFLYRDTVFFRTYDAKSGNGINDLYKANNGTPGFYAVTLHGFSQFPSDVKRIMSGLDDRFVVVSPKNLAKLYKQYYQKEFKDITYADVTSGFNRKEMGFMYYNTDHLTYNQFDGSRTVDGDNFIVYKLDLADSVQSGQLQLTLAGDYSVEISNDNLYWQEIVRADEYAYEKQNIKVDISKYIERGKEIYIRIGDRTPENQNGAVFYGFRFTSNAMNEERYDIDTQTDLGVLESSESSAVQAEGRTGTFVYKLGTSANAAGDLAICADGDVKAFVSADNKSFSEVALSKHGESYYGRLDNLQGVFYVKIEAGDSCVSTVRFLKDPAPVKQLSFSPIRNTADLKYSLTGEDYNVNSTALYNTCSEIEGIKAVLYKFKAVEDAKEVFLRLRISGRYEVLVSNDNKEYTSLYKVTSSEVISEFQQYDVTDYAAGGKLFYIKIVYNTPEITGWVSLYDIKLITDLTDEGFLDWLVMGRSADVTWNGFRKQQDGQWVLTDIGKLEEQLFDKSLSMTGGQDAYFEGARKVAEGVEGAYNIYKLDFSESNYEFWKQLGIDLSKTPLTRLTIEFDICHDYVISAATAPDGEWKTMAEANAPNASGGSNRQTVKIKLNEFLVDSDVIYLKISNATTFTTAIYWGMNFYFN